MADSPRDDDWSRPSYAGTPRKPGEVPPSSRRPVAPRPVPVPVSGSSTDRGTDVADDGWGAPRLSRSDPDRAPHTLSALDDRRRPPRPTGVPATTALPVLDDHQWSPAGTSNRTDQRAVRTAERDELRRAKEAERTQRSVERLTQHEAPKPPERGCTWWVAVLVMIVITLVGVAADHLAHLSSSTGFNVGIVVGSLAAIVAVKRSHMFPVVVAPPLVYWGIALIQLYIQSRDSNSHHGVLDTILDSVDGYVVYGFPALAGATAIVLIIGGGRLIARK